MTTKEQMIETIRSYGVTDERVISAVAAVPRESFVDWQYRDVAYEDSPLPIGYDQTISQPYTVAKMIEELELKEGLKVLEIGAGSGWNAAVMKHIVGKKGRVVAVEYVAELVMAARKNLQDAGYEVIVAEADGSLGYELFAPYDRIIVTCAAPEIPPPYKDQLKEGGIILIPLGRMIQQLIKATKKGSGFKTESLGTYRFVPLRGKYGFGRD